MNAVGLQPTPFLVWGTISQSLAFSLRDEVLESSQSALFPIKPSFVRTTATARALSIVGGPGEIQLYVYILRESGFGYVSSMKIRTC